MIIDCEPVVPSSVSRVRVPVDGYIRGSLGTEPDPGMNERIMERVSLFRLLGGLAVDS